jgi:hypothetical protein
MKKIYILLFQLLSLATTIALLCGCMSTPQPQMNISSSQNECLEPLQKLDFPIGEYSQDAGQEENPPPSSWIASAELPDSYVALSMIYFDKSLWIMGFIPGQQDSTAIWKYSLTANDWKKYSSIGNFDRIPSIDFIISPDEILWATTRGKAFDESSKLLRYDSASDSFDYVDDGQHLLSGSLKGIDKRDIDIDQNGHIWLADLNGIYEFSPDTLGLEARVSASDNEQFSRLQIDNENNVWFLDIMGHGIKKYDPKTKESIGSYLYSWYQDDGSYWDNDPGDAYFVNTLHLDAKSRLWLDDKGWFDTQAKDINGGPLWHQVIRSPLFIVKTGLPLPTGYLWEKPLDIYESSNGLLWFSSSRGIVRLETNTAEWCLLALDFPIAEDDQHTVWAFHGSTLFKYQLSK